MTALKNTHTHTRRPAQCALTVTLESECLFKKSIRRSKFPVGRFLKKFSFGREISRCDRL